MCYNGKCMHCIEVETGTMIWAVINTVLSGLALLLGLGVLIYFNVAMLNVIAERSNEEQNIGNAITGVTTIMMLIAIAFIGIVFLFSMFLLVGVIKKRPGYVMAYFIYGVVTSVLFALKILITSFVYGVPDGIVLLIIGSGFVLNCLILRMIGMTYKKFSEGSVNQQFSHKNLVE